MFAIFLHESMTTFYQIISSFPTFIYSVLLIVCIVYWVVAVLGLVELDILDMDMDGDIDLHDSTAAQEGIAGVLMRLGLNGVPLTIVITFISAIGWVISYYAIYLLSPFVPDIFVFMLPFKIATLFVSFFMAVFITAQVIKPLRSVFSRLNIDETKHIVGQTVVVRSGAVTQTKGEGTMEDGGAGLILNIRSNENEEFKKGDLVVVIEQISDQNLYRVVSKSEFDSAS